LSDSALRSKIIPQDDAEGRIAPDDGLSTDFGRNFREHVSGTSSYFPLNQRISVGHGSMTEIEEAIESGRRAGYAEGLRRGLADSEASASLLEQEYLEQVNAVITALMMAKDALDARQDASYEELANELCAAAFELSESIIGRELSADPYPVLSAARRAFRAAPASRHATVRLSPADAGALGLDSAQNEELIRIASGRGLTIIADTSVEVGGAIVEIGATTIDAQIRTAMDRVGRVIRGDDDPSTD
jgi:flagellar assembly protein FliH